MTRDEVIKLRKVAADVHASLKRDSLLPWGLTERKFRDALARLEPTDVMDLCDHWLAMNEEKLQ